MISRLHRSSVPRRRTPIHEVRKWKPSVLLVASLVAACSPTNPVVTKNPVSKSPASDNIPRFLSDPLEPVNRGIWVMNRGVLQGVIQPTSRVYHGIVPKPARTSIRHFNHNVLFPGRVINEALQGRWSDMGDDSLRFLTNSTVGVAGLFDVASRWNMPRPKADFGQTFSAWGWRPGTFLMLPFLGPSDDSHATGLVFDELVEPWNYVDDARILSYATTYNRIVESTEDAVRFIRSEADAYAGVKYAWSYASREDEPDWSTTGPKDLATIQTLGVATFRTKDPDFIKFSRESSASIPDTGKKLKFTYWLQKSHAPVVYLAPGLGSNRLSTTNLVTAEYLFQKGFSVIATTSVFHPHFMEKASTAALPAHPPTDSREMLNALSAIDRLMEKRHPGKLGPRALIGLSMGGFQALYLSARENQQDAGQIRFERYVAINPPINLHHGIECLDQFHAAPDVWPAETRQQRVDNAVHKAAKVIQLPPEAMMNPPFDKVESKYLIGLNFRLTLRDVLYSTQRRKDMAVLTTPISAWRRDEAYQEMLGLSYRNYFDQFVLPYYQTKGIEIEDFKRHGDLHHDREKLRSQSKAYVLTNENDFLLHPEDIAWLRGTFKGSRLTLFPTGGHLGNLASPPMQEAIFKALSGMQ
jgi:ABC-type transporter lipoprotein component MlaA/pimeloyl-ACP methyl ester carboxylesterase